jgi:hypothetical protein
MWGDSIAATVPADIVHADSGKKAASFPRTRSSSPNWNTPKPKITDCQECLSSVTISVKFAGMVSVTRCGTPSMLL